MRLAFIFAINQIVSHGFGIFLFAALVPVIRESITLSHWQLATIGTATQLAYLIGAMTLSVFAHKVKADKLILLLGLISSSLLASLSIIINPIGITCILFLLAACAAASWGTIVSILSQHSDSRSSSTHLATAASGTAWGYGINGLLLLLVVPNIGWPVLWQLSALAGVSVVITTWLTLRHLPTNTSTATLNREPNLQALGIKALIFAIRHQFSAKYSCIICFFVGLTTMPLVIWLNTYFEQIGLASHVSGYTWTAMGLTGMAAGFIAGKIADKYGHAKALFITSTGFALGLIALLFAPSQLAILVGVGYGLLYFPVWGIVAGWLRQHYSATATMQISSLAMVASGFGGALGNIISGYIRQSTGSLEMVFYAITFAAVLLVLLTLYISYRGSLEALRLQMLKVS